MTQTTSPHEGEWYYCLTHNTVEPYDGCKAGDRLGPYPTPADAANALEHAEERNEAYDTDPRFHDLEDEEDQDEDEEKVEGGWGPFRW